MAAMLAVVILRSVSIAQLLVAGTVSQHLDASLPGQIYSRTQLRYALTKFNADL
jgi:hypothetical protein